MAECPAEKGNLSTETGRAHRSHASRVLLPQMSTATAIPGSAAYTWAAPHAREMVCLTATLSAQLFLPPAPNCPWPASCTPPNPDAFRSPGHPHSLPRPMRYTGCACKPSTHRAANGNECSRTELSNRQPKFTSEIICMYQTRPHMSTNRVVS
jgi:hypothetical protein